MDLLLILLVLLMLFVILPLTVIVGLVIIFYPPARKKVRAMFGNGAGQDTKTVVEDKDDITQDFVDFMGNSVGYVNRNYTFTGFNKSNKGAVDAEIELLSLFDERLPADEKQNYLQVLIDNGFKERVIAVDENNPFVKNKLVDEMNSVLLNAFGRDAWDNSSVLVQNVFQKFKNDYQGEHSVDGVNVMVSVRKSDVVKLEDFDKLSEAFNV